MARIIKKTSLDIDPRVWKAFKRMCVSLDIPIYKKLEMMMITEIRTSRGLVNNEQKGQTKSP